MAVQEKAPEVNNRTECVSTIAFPIRKSLKKETNMKPDFYMEDIDTPKK